MNIQTSLHGVNTFELSTNIITMVNLGVEIAESLEVANREPGTDTSSHIRWVDALSHLSP